jgi:hypothetical protein
MPVNLFGIIAISIALSGCFSSAKKEVIIVEKSFNQQNISETPWTEETTSYKKNQTKIRQ